jgi:hypothetical protein
MTAVALKAYLDGRASQIRSEEWAVRVVKLAVEYLTFKGVPEAPVSYWTPSRQLEFASWLRGKFKHSPATIERAFGVLSAAFLDATKVKIRYDAFGREIEGSLMSHAPKMVLKEKAVRAALKLPAKKAAPFVPTLDEMAALIDAMPSEHLKRWALLAMATWARPEAIIDFDPYVQWDRRTGVIDLDPPGRPQTNKRRARIVCCETLRLALEDWTQPRTLRGSKLPDEYIEKPWPLIYLRERVRKVQATVKLAALGLGMDRVTQRSVRTFMATQVRKSFPLIPREKRSLWLGHTVQEGSRTTDHYEIMDADYLTDVALATDYVIQQVRTRCLDKTFAVEVRLNPEKLKAIGVRHINENVS